jgi:hypothetical protein
VAACKKLKHEEKEEATYNSVSFFDNGAAWIPKKCNMGSSCLIQANGKIRSV